MTSTPAKRPAPALDRFFDTLRRSPVTRSQNRVIAGVCGGIAERLGVSTAFVRVAAVILALLGPAIVLYFLAWLMLPDEQGRIRLERAIRDGDGSSITLLVVAAVVIVPDLFGHAHFGWLPLVGLAVLAFVGAKKGWWQQIGRGQRGSTSASPWSTTAPSTPPPSSGHTGPDGSPQDAPRA